MILFLLLTNIFFSPKINTNKPPFKHNLCTTQATNNFSWLTNGKIIRTLEPLTTTSVKLSVIVANPGTFDLGANLGVLCNTIDNNETPVLQIYDVPSSLIVIDSDS